MSDFCILHRFDTAECIRLTIFTGNFFHSSPIRIGNRFERSRLKNLMRRVRSDTQEMLCYFGASWKLQDIHRYLYRYYTLFTCISKDILPQLVINRSDQRYFRIKRPLLRTAFLADWHLMLVTPMWEIWLTLELLQTTDQVEKNYFVYDSRMSDAPNVNFKKRFSKCYDFVRYMLMKIEEC